MCNDIDDVAVDVSLIGGAMKAGLDKTVSNLLSVTGDILKAGATSAEHYLNEKNWKKVEELIANDKDNFKPMKGWFHRQEDLVNSIKRSVGSEAMTKLFETFQTLYNELAERLLDHEYLPHVIQTLRTITETLPGDSGFCKAASLFIIFVCHYGESSWSESVSSFELLETIGNFSMHLHSAGFAVEEIMCPGSSEIHFSMYTGVAIDLVLPLLNFINKTNCSEIRQGKILENVIKKLQDEMNIRKNVYNRYIALDHDCWCGNSTRPVNVPKIFI